MMYPVEICDDNWLGYWSGPGWKQKYIKSIATYMIIPNKSGPVMSKLEVGTQVWNPNHEDVVEAEMVHVAGDCPQFLQEV